MNYFNEANNLYNSKEYEKAIDYYEKAISNKENEACSYYNSGVCFIKLKEYDKAISMLKLALKIQSDSKYFFNLGYCYAMKNDSKKALVYFNIAWSLNNSDIDCKKAIDILLEKKKS